MPFTFKRLVGVVTVILAWSETDAFPSVWKRDVTSLAGTENSLHQEPTVREVCNTSICQQDANEILESLDKSVDPCDDFYMFACGGWKEKHPATNDTPVVNYGKLMYKNMISEAELTIKEPISEEDISPLKAAKKMYNVCMDVETIDRVGIQPFLVAVFNEFGGWPMALEDWNEEDFSLERTLAVFVRYLAWSPLIRITSVVSPNDTSRHILNIDERGDGIPLFILLDPEFDEERATYVNKIANHSIYLMNATGVNINEESVFLQASQVFEFMIQIQNISSVEASKDLMTLKELQEWSDSALVVNAYAQINWLSFLNTLLADTKVVLDENESVYVIDKEYFLNLVKLLDNTSRRVIANYLQWIVIETQGETILKLIKDDAVRSEGDKSRSTYCSQQTFERFKHVINAQFARKIFSGEDKAPFETLVENLRSSFTSIISNSDWFNDDLRSLAIEKVETLKAYSGYPDMYNNASALIEYYKQVHVGDEHLRNLLLLTQEKRGTLQLLRQPVNIADDKWMSCSPEDPDAYYYPPLNAMFFTFGMLQQDLFKQGRLEALNYGRIGTVAGHELMHGISETYKEGNWSIAERGNLTAKWQCYIDHYNRYNIPELEEHSDKNITVNGTTTLEENVADNTGMYAAYKAYQTYVKNHGTEQSLPGLEEYSNNQMFFIGYATALCDSRTNRELQRQVSRDEHAPKFARVRGTVSNMEHFATAFNCPTGSNMNPLNKCRMW